MTKVRDDSQAMGCIGDHKGNWLPGIVWHRDWLNDHTTDLERLMGRDASHSHVCPEGATHCGDGALGGEHRDVVGPSESGNAANVIAMLMGHKDKVQRLGGQASRFEPGLGLAKPQTTIDQKAADMPRITLRLNEQCIALASTAEAAKPHHPLGYFNCSNKTVSTFCASLSLIGLPSLSRTRTIDWLA